MLKLLAAGSAGLVAVACSPAAAPAPTAAPKAIEASKPAAPAAPAATTAPAAQAPAATAAPKAAWDWKKYSGKKVRVLVPTNTACDFVEPNLKEFTALTGIEVNWEKLAEAQQRQKLQVELTSGMSDVDLFGSHAGQQGAAFSAAGWYEPLDSWINNKDLTNPDWDQADFDANVLKQLGAVNDKLIGILMFAITFPLFYRKDLFQQAGLAVPKTFDEMEAAAAKLTDKAKTQFGMFLRGVPADSVGVWPAFLHNFGGTWLTPDGKAQVNSADSVASIQFYGRMASTYGPPGIINQSWTQLRDLFCQGKGAMFCDSSSIVTNFENPKTSTVVDKVGYALLPGGKAGQNPAINGWLWSMYSKSKNKEASWFFIQWAASKDMEARMQRAGITQPRKSAWQDAQFQKDFGAKHPDLTETLMQSYAKGKAFLYPPFVNVAEARTTYGEVIAAAIQGQDVQKAADAAQAKLLDQQKREAAG